MTAFRLIEPLPLQRLQSLLADDNVRLKPIRVQFSDYLIHNEPANDSSPLQFTWQCGEDGAEPLIFDLDTWGTKVSQANPGSYLKIGTDENHRMVGFSLPLLPQDDKYVYLSFKQGNGEGGKNRWFGRGNRAEEPRSEAAVHELGEKLRESWKTFFPTTLQDHPTLSGDWLLLARLPLADLDPAAAKSRRVALKTLVLEKMAQVFVIAEKLRDESFSGYETAPANETKDSPRSPEMAFPLNQILYGPPGTGKTYHTRNRAVGIIEGLTDEETKATYNREGINERFDEYRKAGQIEFVTFHQAFGYEDFLEGIKPMKPGANGQVTYGIENGVFKRLCCLAIDTPSLPQQAQPPMLAEAETDALFNRVYAQMLREIVSGKRKDFKTKKGPEVTVTSTDETGEKIYIKHKASKTDHAPYLIRQDGLRKLFSTFRTVADIKNVYEDIRDCLGKEGGNASGYWALLNHLKSYAYSPRYVLIIDEINRGNVANIFGELITLLEDDKRAGRAEALTVKLPYSKEDFTVPDNLYLLGTMNTADRSVEALDTALRRRFSFTEMRPEASVIREKVGTNGEIGDDPETVDVALLLEVLNSRLEQLLDRDHCLGHALLLDVRDVAGLCTAFERKILPLLQEYFFGDWGKIGLVLGKSFVTSAAKDQTKHYKMAEFPGYDAAGLRDKKLYRLTEPSSWNVAAFASIYATATT